MTANLEIDQEVEQWRDAIRTHRTVQIRGAGSKFATRPLDVRSQVSSHDRCILDTRAYKGILEYHPSEFTITAKAGTTVREIQETLRTHGQYLPFDPPLLDAGSTLGGLIAAGITGPCRLRYGGIRDFILGVRFLDGQGNLITGGGKVVKNAAGFDLPKMMVGSWGRLGLLLEATFKVFPRPRTYRTIQCDCGTMLDAVKLQKQLQGSPVELDALDIEPPGKLLIRIGGDEATVVPLASRLRGIAGKSATVLSEDNENRDNENRENEDQVWKSLREWNWHREGERLIRIPLTADKMLELDRYLDSIGARRRYSVAGNLVWVALEPGIPITKLHNFLLEQKLRGRILRSPNSDFPNSDEAMGNVVGEMLRSPFAERVAMALDPQRKFA